METTPGTPTDSAADPAVIAGQRPDGSTVDTAVPVDDLGKRPVSRYFNFTVHEAVQKQFSLGIWCNLGPRFGGLKVRLRPFHVGAVVAKREAAERAVRVRLGLNDNDDIPAEEQIGITRAAVVMAITEMEGEVNVGAPVVESQDPEILAQIEGGRRALQKARDYGLEIEDQEGEGLILIHFERLPKKSSSEERARHAEKLRHIVSPLLETSITMLTQLFQTSKALQRVKEEEIYKLGEAYVYGQPGEFDWAD